MTHAISGLDGLGGRLPLLQTRDLDEQQKLVYDGLSKVAIPESEHSGFVARLSDGRFIGPFNAMLRVPPLTSAFGQWTREISGSGIADDVRQVVILTVGAAWRAEFEIYAHTSAAKVVGIPTGAIDAILNGKPPEGLSSDADLVHRFTKTLIVDHHVPDKLYRDTLQTFGEAQTIAILSLIGQYQTISSILVTFQVPAPEPTRHQGDKLMSTDETPVSLV